MSKPLCLRLSVEHWVYIGLVVGGVVLIGIGVIKMRQQPVVEMERVVEASVAAKIAEVAKKVIVVDISGEVVKPGIYSLTEGIRMGEAIASAGGLTRNADGRYVSRKLNLASKLSDGAKVYIPAIGEEESVEEVTTESSSGLVSINNATQSELEGLWGIGESRAKNIISNRPYTSMDELMIKAKIPQNVLDANQEKIGL